MNDFLVCSGYNSEEFFTTVWSPTEIPRFCAGRGKHTLTTGNSDSTAGTGLSKTSASDSSAMLLSLILSNVFPHCFSLAICYTATKFRRLLDRCLGDESRCCATVSVTIAWLLEVAFDVVCVLMAAFSHLFLTWDAVCTASSSSGTNTASATPVAITSATRRQHCDVVVYSS